jgi:hypothetical protein
MTRMLTVKYIHAAEGTKGKISEEIEEGGDSHKKKLKFLQNREDEEEKEDRRTL